MIMTRKLIFSVGIMALTLSTCTMRSKGIDPGDAVKVAVATFEKQAANIVEKTVIIEGTVLHTCKHGGKRMFLVDGNDSVRVEVTAGKDIPKFDEKLVGSRLRVLGVLKEEKIDEKYLNEWENEVKKPIENHDAGVHAGAKGHEDQGTQDKLDQINALREDLKRSGKDHLSFYSIEATQFEETKK
jgi:alpha-glucuronidase